MSLAACLLLSMKDYLYIITRYRIIIKIIIMMLVIVYNYKKKSKLTLVLYIYLLKAYITARRQAV